MDLKIDKTEGIYCNRINENVTNSCQYYTPNSRNSCKRHYSEIRPCDLINSAKVKGLTRKLDKDKL